LRVELEQSRMTGAGPRSGYEQRHAVLGRVVAQVELLCVLDPELEAIAARRRSSLPQAEDLARDGELDLVGGSTRGKQHGSKPGKGGDCDQDPSGGCER